LNKQKRRTAKPHTAQKISLKHNQIILDYSSQIVYNINCGYGEIPMFHMVWFRHTTADYKVVATLYGCPRFYLLIKYLSLLYH